MPPISPPAAIARVADQLAALRGLRRMLVAALFGALVTMALPPFHLLPVLLIAFAGLVWLAAGARSWRGAFLIGWVFGFGHFASALYWVAEAFSVAGVAVWAAPFAVAALAAACAIFPGLVVLAYHGLTVGGAVRSAGFARIAAFASLWTAAEWLRGHAILGGFPWALTGYAWMPADSMLQFASLFGVLGLSWVTVFAAAAPATLAWSRRSLIGLTLSWLLLVVIAIGGAVRLAGADLADVPGIGLRLVQANISQFHKWQDDLRAAHLERHIALSTAPADDPPTLVIWPETAAPYLLENEPGIRARIATAVPADGVLLTGAVRSSPTESGEHRIWNSLHAVNGDGDIIATYDKFHLVPFGEYTPFRSLLSLAKLTQGKTDFSRGPGIQTMRLPGLPPVSPLICYEAIFPGAVVAPRARPEWMLNVTNDGWYGISIGPYQHFAQTRLRAVEEGIPMIRVANTGLSGVVDSYGRVRAMLGLGVAGRIDAPMPGALARPTLYARWHDWPVFGVLLACLFWLYAGRNSTPSRISEPHSDL
jgi:apolipoprotein N-acyltransferase